MSPIWKMKATYLLVKMKQGGASSITPLMNF